MVTPPRVKLRTQEGRQGEEERRKQRSGESRKNKEKIEGRKRRKKSLYAPLSVLGLVVTKESIKIARSLASERQRFVRETRQEEPSFGP